MQSPITGKEMQLLRKKRILTFRKEHFEVVFYYYHCPDSGESFTTTVLDEKNIKQVHQQYRTKHNIPFPEDICRIRNKYQLPAAKMSEVLGLGVNSYRNYEAGEMPSLSNAKLIQLAGNEEEFVKLAGLCESLNKKAMDRIISKTDKLIKEKQEKQKERSLLEYVFGGVEPGPHTGYTRPNLVKLTEMVIYFAERMKPWKTKLNKLLFYADFLMFGQNMQSISGLRYRAISMGPVPVNFDSLYEYLANENHIDIEYAIVGNGHTGERFIPAADRPSQQAVFSPSEMDVLEKVAARFKDISAREMIGISHHEKAWIDNQAGRGLIDYSYGFELEGIQ